MRILAIVLIALAAGIAGGVGGTWLFLQMVASAPSPDAPPSYDEFRDEITALKNGTTQTRVPAVVERYIADKLQRVPYAERAGTADHALIADTAKEADFAQEAARAEEATHALEADIAAKADEAVTAAHATVADSADEALYAAEAGVATRADEAEEAKFARESRNRERYYLADRTALGVVDEEDEASRQANFRRSGLASVETRRSNLVEALRIAIELEANRPVYVALGNGQLELDAASAGEFFILRDGNPVFRGELSNPSDRDPFRVPAGAVSTIDTPGPGVHEYQIQITAQDGRIALREVQLLAIQL